MSEPARQRAQVEHPLVHHVLDFPELRSEFSTLDTAANEAKKVSQAAGVWAVILAFVSLLGGSSEAIWRGAPSPWPQIVAVCSAAIGLVAFALAVFIVKHGKGKDAWLRTRLMTERMRQFHFQAFLSRLPEMVASVPAGATREKAEYRTQRVLALGDLADRFGHKELANVKLVINPRRIPEIWLYGSNEEPRWPGLQPSPELTDAFNAYFAFRFEEQKGYAEYVLRDRNEPGKGKKPKRSCWYPGVTQPLERKRKVLSGIWMAALAILVVLHFLILASHFAHWQLREQPWIHVGVIWAALLAVAAKTLTEGLAVTREIERYEEYLAIVLDLATKFQSSNSPEEKFRRMVEMEKTAFEEMRAFLRSNWEATFLM